MKDAQQGLFTTHEQTPPDLIVVHIDGGARGNPGPAGYGVVVHDAQGKKLASWSEFLGHRTNNFAEYAALIAALEFALRHQHKALRVLSDSELLVRQWRGLYRVRSPELRTLYEKARALARKLEYFEIQHVPRARNREADRLANQAMDRGMETRPG